VFFVTNPEILQGATDVSAGHQVVQPLARGHERTRLQQVFNDRHAATISAMQV